MVVVRPAWVSTVTMPPFWAPAIVTGPLALAFWPFPVSPPLKDGVDDGPLEEPVPPQAASASSPTEDRATNGILSLIYAPFADSSVQRRLAERVHRGAPARSAWAGPLVPREPAVRRESMSAE